MLQIIIEICILHLNFLWNKENIAFYKFDYAYNYSIKIREKRFVSAIIKRDETFMLAIQSIMMLYVERK